MGGLGTHIAAERYGDRFDGGLALCGAAGQTPSVSIATTFFVAGAFAAGVTRREFEDADVGELVRDRILPALRRPRAHRRFEDIMISVTGGPRPFSSSPRLQFVSWPPGSRRTATPCTGSGRPARCRAGSSIARPSASAPTRQRGASSWPATRPAEGCSCRLSLYTIGDGQVPFEQARTFRERVDAAGSRRLLVHACSATPGTAGSRAPNGRPACGPSSGGSSAACGRRGTTF
jgi:hypothetical protein